MSDLWFACEQPERQPDAYVMWHYSGPDGSCSTCAFKASVQQHLFPDSTHVRWLVGMTAAPSEEGEGPA